MAVIRGCRQTGVTHHARLPFADRAYGQLSPLPAHGAPALAADCMDPYAIDIIGVEFSLPFFIF